MGFPVFLYHEVSHHSSIITTPVDFFRFQMDWLEQVGIEVIPLSEVVSRIINSQSLPSKAISLTFDDGLAGVYQYAYPILCEFSFPAVLFPVTNFCGLNNNWPGQPDEFSDMKLMSWEEIRELSEHGFEIGAHSMTHPRLDRLSPTDLSRQIAGSKEAIMERINRPVDFFSYPFGRYNQAVYREVRSHFNAACTTRFDLVHNKSDRYLLSRLETHYFQNPYAMRLLLSSALPAYLAIRRMLRSVGSFAYDRPWV